jgi:release factor glutamine methyltransferase
LANFPVRTAPISDILPGLIQAFEGAGIETANLDARLLVQHVTKLTHSEFIQHKELVLSVVQSETLSDLAQRRLKREPISRILGQSEFWSLPFLISEDTLDPRPDTETLIEHALENFGPRKNEPLRLLDLGTGSGCILLSLLHELPFATGIGADINPGALEIAQKNAIQLGLERRVKFQKSDWFSTIEGKFDCILSNPPYIPESELEKLMPEVRHFDPALALNGGETGLEPYEIIFDKAKEFLAPSSLLLLEFGQKQDTQLVEMLYKSNLEPYIQNHDLKSDLAGTIRTLAVKLSF